MPPTGVTDLAAITDRLVALIRTALQNAGLSFSFTVSGAMPESVRADSGAQVSLYLYHVSADATARNSPVAGPQLPRQRPLGLELSYLLTAFAGKEYTREQHVMTIAMRAMQDTPVLRLGATAEELTVALSTEGIDKLGVLWQAVSAPFRLTATYRVAVAFLAPTQTAPVAAPKPTAFTLTADPAQLPFGDARQLLGSYIRVTHLTPASTPANLLTRSYDLSPAVVAPGGRAALLGTNFLPTDQILLLDVDGANERDVTAWRAASPAEHTSTRILIDLPASIGVGPSNSPAPGIYMVRVGAGTVRTNGVAISIAAGVANVANPPLLTAAAGVFTLEGVGFVNGETEVLLESVALTESSAAPTDGEFQITSTTSIQFHAPGGLPTGRYGVRIRVAGVESAPSWWVDL